MVGLVGLLGSELTSLRQRNDRFLKERDAARDETVKTRSELTELARKFQADLEAARLAAVEEYKASEDYRNMRDDLYATGINEAVRILGPKNPTLDTTDLDEDSESRASDDLDGGGDKE